MISLSATRAFKAYHFEVSHNLSKNVIYLGSGKPPRHGNHAFNGRFGIFLYVIGNADCREEREK